MDVPIIILTPAASSRKTVHLLLKVLGLLLCGNNGRNMYERNMCERKKHVCEEHV